MTKEQRWDENKKEKRKKNYEMPKGKKSDFERIEGEEIMRVRNQNQDKTEKQIKFKMKKGGGG